VDNTDNILEKVVDELMRLGEPKFFNTIMLLKLVIARANEMNQEIVDLRQKVTAEQSRADNAERMLKRANEALERAGSAARVGTKLKIPEGALVFIDTIETLSRDWSEDEPAYSQRQWDKQQKTIAALNVALETCINRLEFLDSPEARFYRSSNKFWIDTTKSLLQVIAREGEGC